LTAKVVCLPLVTGAEFVQHPYSSQNKSANVSKNHPTDKSAFETGLGSLTIDLGQERYITMVSLRNSMRAGVARFTIQFSRDGK
jgi:hypothetical protein